MLDTSLKLKQSLLTIRLVYFTFLISLALCLFIPNILIKGNPASFESFIKFKEIGWLKNILYLISLLTTVIILILRRFLDNPNRIPLIPNSNMNEILRLLISGNIVIFALCEVLVLYGVILFLIAGRLGEFYLLIGISFVLLLICFPKRDKWEKVVSQFI